MPFRGFTEPTGDRTSSAQLQEWADYFRVSLTWQETTIRHPNGSAETQCIPVINGHVYAEHVARDARKKVAKNRSAELVILSGLP
ncbi:hypothetical protein FRC07_005425, partial [Ceratobasidium sp. 392]